MHEMSIIVNLFEILEEQAADKNAKKVLTVKLQVGVLSGVVPEFLQTAFDMYKKDTFASEAELEVVEIPLEIECLDCRKSMKKDDFVFICEHCGSTKLKTLSGTELLLEKFEAEV